MCKHILINDLNLDKDLDVLSEFACRSYDRDGFGAVLQYADGGIKTLKSLNDLDFYITLVSELHKDKPLNLVVHHRTSTNYPGIEYAHPFEYKGYFMTHNGVVDVPGKHETKTHNDSEALLHHLIKTNYETKSIDGYFSCFILNKKYVQLIVDNKAPIYVSPDDRIYSSHQIDKDWKSVTLSHIKIPLGVKGYQHKEIMPIEVKESDYGRDKAYLSLGNSDSYDEYQISDIPETSTHDIAFWQLVDGFFSLISQDEDKALYSMADNERRLARIKELSVVFGLEFDNEHINAVNQMYLE